MGKGSDIIWSSLFIASCGFGFGSLFGLYGTRGERVVKTFHLQSIEARVIQTDRICAHDIFAVEFSPTSDAYPMLYHSSARVCHGKFYTDEMELVKVTDGIVGDSYSVTKVMSMLLP